MKIDQYSLAMLLICVALLSTFAITREPAILDLTKVAFGALIGVFVKKAETTVVVGDAASKYVSSLIGNKLDS